MTELSHSALPGPFQALVKWFRRQQAMREFEGLDPGLLQEISSDLRVSVDDLRKAVAQSEDEIALVRRMLALHGLSPEQLDVQMPDLMRDMALTCARCGEKGHCAREFGHGLTAAKADAFCPNASTMAALSRAQGSLS